MLESLRIRDLGLIAEAEIDFMPGFVAITGETGAGKTLLLDAVRVLRGEKPAVVGSALDKEVTVDAAIGVTDQMNDEISELGIAADDGSILVSRTFPISGRAKTAVGGRPFPASTLENLSNSWLAIHGQHDSLRLLKPQTHRELLDAFGGEELSKAQEIFNISYVTWKSSLAELAKVEKSRRELLVNAENIKADLAIFDSLNVNVGDVEEIARTVERVSRKEEFKTAITASIDALNGEETPIANSLRLSRLQLEKLSSDNEIGRIRERLKNLAAELADIEGELASQLNQIDSEEDDLDSLMLRQRQIKALLLRHGPDETDLIDWAQNAKRQLALIDPDGIELKLLKERVAAEEKITRQNAKSLSEIRHKFAEVFSSSVTLEIRELAMPAAQFMVEISEVELSEFGIDKIEFLFNANPGMKFQPLASAASGGELSRVMLALEVALLSTSSPSVLIFDEVDAGVAGAAAIAVGEKLTKLSQKSQVLVVTHLPQIAAFADQHIHVAKSSDGKVTQTSIHTLDLAERVTELSRMLAGLEGSISATAHAQELLEMVNELKNPI